MQIFWKARNRAKEELNEQLTHFQQKRSAGLAMSFGPIFCWMKAYLTKLVSTLYLE